MQACVGPIHVIFAFACQYQVAPLSAALHLPASPYTPAHDFRPGNIVFELMPGTTSNGFQLAAAAVVLPLNALAGNSGFLSAVAYAGAGALFIGVATTCWYGFSVTPDFVGNLASLPWFTSPQEYFTSFGVVPLLFCVHFAVLSIERNMKTRQDFPAVLNRSQTGCCPV